LSLSSLALAEMVFKHGYSAVCVSSVFHPEFMEHASTAAVPAYLPVDGNDLQVALTEIDRGLRGEYRDRLGETALLGYSMGAFHSLYIAATAATNPAPLIKFDRYVAISTPVRLLYGVSKLDEFYQAPMAWPAAEREGDLENTLLKVASLSRGTLTPQTFLPFDTIESRFLIGMTFRFTLRDVIYSSQRRNNQGVLRQPIHTLRRAPLYREISQYSYRDYFDRFVLPYYRNHGLPATTEEALAKADDLKTYSEGLRINPDVRVVVNQNDFLLGEEDLAWLRDTIPPERLTVFAQGGHLGNLANPAVQRTILGALEGLRSSPHPFK
jgi:pimeloyl-ACP methyl ester carboxylesterase